MRGCDILQWNCKGLHTCAEELKVLLRDNNPGVICLQETKLGPEMFNPGLNYKIFSSAPPAGDCVHGGAAIIVHKSLQYSPLPVVTDLQAAAVTVVLDKQITICSVYFHPVLILLMLTSNFCWINFHHHFCLLVILMHIIRY